MQQAFWTFAAQNALAQDGSEDSGLNVMGAPAHGPADTQDHVDDLVLLC